MSISEVLLLSLALSADAMVVSIICGCGSVKARLSHALKAGFFFGFFQAIMPLLGWYGGNKALSHISKYGNWTAFILLTVIGLKMIIDSRKDEKNDERCAHFETVNLLIMAIATSIDALAVGISFALLNIPAFFPALIIGFITFILSVIGVFFGRKIGAFFRNSFELAGGFILILIGLKILLTKS